MWDQADLQPTCSGIQSTVPSPASLFVTRKMRQTSLSLRNLSRRQVCPQYPPGDCFTCKIMYTGQCGVEHGRLCVLLCGALGSRRKVPPPHFSSHTWPEPHDQEVCPKPSCNRVAEKSVMQCAGVRPFEMPLITTALHGLSGHWPADCGLLVTFGGKFLSHSCPQGLPQNIMSSR